MHSQKLIKVLLVDDNKDDVFFMKKAINESPPLALINVLPNGAAALDYLRDNEKSNGINKPDLILVDINMPIMSGFEMLQAIKNDPVLRLIPSIVFTSSNRDEDIIRAYENGASNYIQKPFEFSKLESIIKKIADYWSTTSLLPIATKQL